MKEKYMTENNKSTAEQSGSSTSWEKMVQDYWATLLGPMGQMFQSFDPGKQFQSEGRVAESFNTSMRMWQSMLAAMSEPGAFEHFQRATEMTPSIALGFSQTCLQSFTTLQAQAGEWIQKRGASLTTADIQELDRELIKNLTETYEKEFSRYLKLPQLGLGRLYQERSLRVIDKMNTLQLVLSEFLHMLYRPIEKSLNSLQDEMAQMTEAGLDEKPKTYYNLWIKLLEGHYMELFQQKEYGEVLGKTIGAVNEFAEAKHDVVNDLLKQVNVPTNEDIDDLSKEIYLLKKRVRTLEQK